MKPSLKSSFTFSVITLSVLLTIGCNRYESQSPETTQQNQVDNQTEIIAEAACGQCQFGLEGKKGCDLAVRIDGKSYYVDGTSIDDHGDAHAEDGLCNCVRKAKVTGEIKDGRFVASSFEVLSDDDDQ